MPDHDPILNLSVKSNIWIECTSPAFTREQAAKHVYEARKYIPGDLMIEFFQQEFPLMNPRSTDLVKKEMTEQQRQEYLAYRFFLHHGQVGLAFEPTIRSLR